MKIYRNAGAEDRPQCRVQGATDRVAEWHWLISAPPRCGGAELPLGPDRRGPRESRRGRLGFVRDELRQAADRHVLHSVERGTRRSSPGSRSCQRIQGLGRRRPRVSRRGLGDERPGAGRPQSSRRARGDRRATRPDRRSLLRLRLAPGGRARRATGGDRPGEPRQDDLLSRAAATGSRRRSSWRCGSPARPRSSRSTAPTTASGSPPVASEACPRCASGCPARSAGRPSARGPRPTPTGVPSGCRPRLGPRLRAGAGGDDHRGGDEPGRGADHRARAGTGRPRRLPARAGSRRSRRSAAATRCC